MLLSQLLEKVITTTYWLFSRYLCEHMSFTICEHMSFISVESPYIALNPNCMTFNSFSKRSLYTTFGIRSDCCFIHTLTLTWWILTLWIVWTLKDGSGVNDSSRDQHHDVQSGVYTTVSGPPPVLWCCGERRYHGHHPHLHFRRRRRRHLRNGRAAEACHSVETASQHQRWRNRGRVLQAFFFFTETSDKKLNENETFPDITWRERIKGNLRNNFIIRWVDRCCCCKLCLWSWCTLHFCVCRVKSAPFLLEYIELIKKLIPQ